MPAVSPKRRETRWSRQQERAKHINLFGLFGEKEGERLKEKHPSSG